MIYTYPCNIIDFYHILVVFTSENYRGGRRLIASGVDDASRELQRRMVIEKRKRNFLGISAMF